MANDFSHIHVTSNLDKPTTEMDKKRQKIYTLSIKKENNVHLGNVPTIAVV